MNPDLSPEQHYRTAWIVLGAMVAGVALFAGVAVVLREAADPGLPFFALWAALGPIGLVAAKIVQSRMPATAGDGRGPDRSDSPPDVARAFTAHVLAWALIEGPAMLGIVGFLMGASTTLLTAALLTAGVGFALTAPRRAAFGLG